MPNAETTLGRLKAAMALKGDMPAMPSALSRILDSGRPADASEADLAQVVLSDFAMTQRVLRLANSSMYSGFGPISTVSRAIFVLGTDAVQHLAMSVKMLDNLGQAAETETARRELGKAVAAAAISRGVASTVAGKEGEAAAVATLMRCLGRLLVCFYLPKSFDEISTASQGSCTDEASAVAVLGLSYAEIARSVAKGWKLPEELVERTGTPGPDASPHARWLHSLAEYSHAYVGAVSRGEPSNELLRLATQFEDAIGTTAAVLGRQAAEATQHAQPGAGSEGLALPSDGRRAADRPPLVALTTGIDEIERSLDDQPLGRVLSMAAEVLWASLNGRNAFFFLHNAARGVYELILAYGDRSNELVRKVSFEDAFSPNAVHLALSRGKPIFLADAQQENVARRIPEWYKRVSPSAQALLILPVMSRTKAGGVITLDWGIADRPTRGLSAAELHQVDRLREVVSAGMERAVAAQTRTAVPA